MKATDSLGIPDIAADLPDATAFPAGFSNDPGRIFVVTVVAEDHLGTFPRKGLRDGRANAAAAAGDQCNPVGKLLGHRFYRDDAVRQDRRRPAIAFAAR
ncbi:hypothetical protein D3C87_1960870 [compost metagenome]